ncbi:hypothetical protein [Desulfofalx alkaliphila]|uniref:hypothetical protein n=1 Tax=Desulfofalx alkaliphila TaxID=105483 RepID=UPI0004E10C62|nr:hypothetical protein [Desulfofalx alkaliphila]
MSNMVPKTNESDAKIHKGIIARGLEISATLGTWAVLVFAVVWLLAAIGWYMLARLWWQELFVPDAVASLIRIGLITLLWAVLLGCSALLWAGYHKRRYYKNNRRKVLPLIMESNDPHQNPIIGINVQEDFKDDKGRVVLMKGEVITPEIIDRITARGLYGIFVVYLTKQLLETIKE